MVAQALVVKHPELVRKLILTGTGPAGGKGIDKVAGVTYSDILRATLSLEPDAYRLDDRLKELTFGSWEGYTWRDIRKAEREQAQLRERDKWSFVPPGGESYAMLAQRIRPVLEELKPKRKGGAFPPPLPSAEAVRPA